MQSVAEPMRDVYRYCPRVCVVTYIPSPYQVELFNAVQDSLSVDLTVYYLHSGDTKSDIARRWALSGLRHSHVFLDLAANEDCDRRLNDFDLVIINYYQHPFVQKWINCHNRTDRQTAWCLWGERPGVRLSGFLGRYVRRWRLRTLLKEGRPIWGIGEWAVRRYREEFGSRRLLINVPYFSDLSRFTAVSATDTSTHREGRTIVFSGSLIHRKGVDLLTKAYECLASEFPETRLSIIGTGPWESWMQIRLRRFSDLVQFHGFQPWDQLAILYAEGDILCIPSRYDGWAMVVPEGLAAGMPVVASDRTGAAYDLIKNTDQGLIFKAGCLRSLIECLRKALTRDIADVSISRRAAMNAVSAHSLEHGVTRFADACHMTISVDRERRKN